MVTLDLSRVDRKAQDPRPIEASVLLVHFGLTPSHILEPNWEGPKGLPN